MASKHVTETDCRCGRTVPIGYPANYKHYWFPNGSEAQKQLQEIARVADGKYATANNQEELQAEFKRAEEVLEAWEKWKRDALKDVKAGQVDAYFDIIAIHLINGARLQEEQ